MVAFALETRTGTPPLGSRSGTFREPADRGALGARTIAAAVPLPELTAGHAGRIAKIGGKTADQPSRCSVLFHLDRGARVFELFLHRGGLVLADVLFHRLGRAVDKVLGLLEAEACELADGLDDVDLRRARFLEYHRELGLLLGLGGRGRAASAAAGCGHRDRRCGDAPPLLEGLAELGDPAG